MLVPSTFTWLVDEDDDKRGDCEGDEQVAKPQLPPAASGGGATTTGAATAACVRGCRMQ